MSKTATVHVRVAPDIKEKAEKVFASTGLTTSQAVSLFLTSVANHNGIPFELTAPSQEDQDVAFATAIQKTGGGTTSPEAIRILRLYAKGEIDFETAEFAITKRISK